MKQFFSSVKDKVALFYLNSGMKVMSFRSRHPYIFAQLLILAFGLLGNILFSIYKTISL